MARISKDKKRLFAEDEVKVVLALEQLLSKVIRKFGRNLALKELA